MTQLQVRKRMSQLNLKLKAYFVLKKFLYKLRRT